MLLSLICYYTSSNDLNPFGTFIFLVFMALVLIIALRIWIGDKINDYKNDKVSKIRDSILTQEAIEIISAKVNTNGLFYQIKFTSNWRQWFIKGYIHGATFRNYYSDYYEPSKSISDYTLEDWENHQLSSMKDIKDNSEYFGGNKKLALYAFFQGHKYGLIRYDEKGKLN